MDLRENWKRICQTVEQNCQLAGRNVSEVTVIAVSKTVPIERIKAAYDLGIRDFGESKLQEALPKIAQLPNDICWHFIGRLQTNKIRKIADSFQVIHSLESVSHVQELEKSGKEINALIAVNVAEETQKSGVFIKNLDELCNSLLSSQLVRFRGLMTIGPLVDDPEKSRVIFRELASLRAKFVADWLSMGMSADYDVAIQEGATHIRLGSVLFGERI